jgi:hypothetical protein
MFESFVISRHHKPLDLWFSAHLHFFAITGYTANKNLLSGCSFRLPFRRNNREPTTVKMNIKCLVTWSVRKF